VLEWTRQSSLLAHLVGELSVPVEAQAAADFAAHLFTGFRGEKKSDTRPEQDAGAECL
jgi:hypothetical protein